MRTGRLHPIEIKKSANSGKDAIAAFRVLADAGKSAGPGGVICCSTEYLPLDAQNSIVPRGGWYATYKKD